MFNQIRKRQERSIQISGFWMTMIIYLLYNFDWPKASWAVWKMSLSRWWLDAIAMVYKDAQHVFGQSPILII